MGRARGNYVVQDYPGVAGAQAAAQRRPCTFRAFVPAPIADLELAVSTRLAADVEAASAAVRALNDSPPKLASLEAVSRHLLRQESTASSRIEGLSLGHRRIALADFDLEGSNDQKAADIVGNIRAMVGALELGDSGETITPEHIQGIHRTLLRFGQDELIAGTWRTRQGWIGGSAPTTAAYVPPPHKEIARLMKDLCVFMNRTDIPVLMQAAVAHAQFENIHPFVDGNGRVGRCLIHTVLRRRGLAPQYVPPISVVIAARRDAYFAGLAEFRDADEIEQWLTFFAEATAVAAQEADELSLRIDELEEQWLAAFLRRPRSNSSVRRVIGMLPAHPMLSVSVVQNELHVSDVAAGNALNELARVGVIRLVNNKVRGRVWECPTMYNLMAEFEQSLA